MKTIKNVTIGDKFKKRGVSNTIYTVVDFLTTTNLNGDVVRQTVLAEATCLGQTVKSEQPFSTVVRGRIQ